ncbi:MAG TPA: ATP-binding protein [Candidatus Saccharimonadales bacterium]|nr:ATP-binding protein [Candidatus Saccharimonadales bacterium]
MVISHAQTDEPDTQQELTSFVKIFSLLGLIVLVLFGAQSIAFEGDYRVGYFEFIAGLIMGLNFITLKITKNVNVARNVLLSVLLAILMMMLTTGGLQGTGLYWFYIFPVTAFFVSGKPRGIIWVAILYLFTLVVLGLDAAKVLSIPFSAMQVVQMLIILFIVSFAIYVYQQVRETATSASKRNKEDLQTERVRVDAVVENIAEGVVSLDVDGRVNFMNRAAEDMLGWWQHDLQGKKFVNVVKTQNENGKEVKMDEWPLGANKKDKKSTVLNYIKKDGTKSLLLANGSPIMREGECVGYVASLRDVAEERAIERAKSEFMTVASHQLRTPISAISWFSEMLLNGDAGKLNDEQEQDVTQIHQSTQRMARLVGDMLIVARLELNNLPVVPQAINLPVMLRKVVREQLEGIPEGRLPKIKEHFDQNISDIYVDPEIVKIILHNLVGNAVKYTPKGGDVSIEVIGSGNEPDSKLTIIVSDSGYGIPKAQQAKIFTRFFRAENIRDKDTDGTGLGLFIVKSLLDYIGGDISFTSEENQGTIFVVHLPYTKTMSGKK